MIYASMSIPGLEKSSRRARSFSFESEPARFFRSSEEGLAEIELQFLTVKRGALWETLRKLGWDLEL